MSRQAPLLSTVLVTMRPAFLPAICAMLEHQTYSHRELIVGLHGQRISDLGDAQRQALAGARTVLEFPRDWSLGRCLNAGIAESHGIFVAKIDDDDLYGRNYLEEAVEHLSAGRGDIVGKAETYIYLEGSGIIVLRRPGASLKTVNYVSGPTLVFPRTIALKHPFRDVTLREDSYFLEDCRLSGTTVYSTSRRHFLHVRRSDRNSHTAPYGDAEFIGSGIVLKNLPHAAPDQLFALIDGTAATDLPCHAPS